MQLLQCIELLLCFRPYAQHLKPLLHAFINWSPLLTNFNIRKARVCHQSLQAQFVISALVCNQIVRATQSGVHFISPAIIPFSALFDYLFMKSKEGNLTKRLPCCILLILYCLFFLLFFYVFLSRDNDNPRRVN